MSAETAKEADVIVVGGGNAGLVAAVAAAERGRRVLLLEKGEPDSAGGNSYYTAGATRIVHGGLDDLRALVVEDERLDRTTVPAYSADDFRADMEKVTQGRNDPALTETVIAEGRSTLQWLKDAHGLEYRLMYERQSYLREDGGYLFWGGLHVGNVDGGVGLVEKTTEALLRLGGRIRYGTRVTELIVEDGRVAGVSGIVAGEPAEFRAESVILAAGGFEANADMRERHLGPGWSRAKVRGTPHNTGDLLEAAIAIGADRAGDWSTCHSTAWDAEHPENESNRVLTNRLTRQSYPLSIVVNREGRRFLDEGENFRNYTYAKYGREILAQPGSIAYQIYDAKTRPLLRAEEYEMPGVSVYEADGIPALAEAAGIDRDGFERTVADFNASIRRDAAFDPTVLDGRHADVEPPKSNWASAIDEAPFYAYPVTCGITFTFGGLRSDLDGRVLRENGAPIPGLFVAGEMLGGLFSGNYPGGTGLAAGAVFGRRAGVSA